MEIEEALTTYLLAQTGLTALIDRRFSFDIQPQFDTLPAVVCINVSDVKDHHLTGQTTYESPVYQFTVYATTRAGAMAVGDQLKTALKDYSGTLSGLVVQYIKILNELRSTYTSPEGLILAHIYDLEIEVYFERS